MDTAVLGVAGPVGPVIRIGLFEIVIDGLDSMPNLGIGGSVLDELTRRNEIARCKRPFLAPPDFDEKPNLLDRLLMSLRGI